MRLTSRLALIRPRVLRASFTIEDGAFLTLTFASQSLQEPVLMEHNLPDIDLKNDAYYRYYREALLTSPTSPTTTS
jgi:hypothetical protein